MCVEGQENVTLAPTIAGWLEPITSMMSSFNKRSSEPQLTMKILKVLIHICHSCDGQFLATMKEILMVKK